MENNVNSDETARRPVPFSYYFTIFQRRIVQATLVGLLLFVAAGTVKIPLFWAYLILSLVLFLGGMLPVLARDQPLDKERSTQNKKKGSKAVINRYQVAPALIFLFAGLDVGRLHWSDSVPLSLSLVGLVVVSVGTLLLTWSVHVNTFFSNTIRIQSDRHHRAVTAGPYRFVRHPGYLGMILNYIGICFALGSWLSLFFGAATAFVFIQRAAKEDKFLQEKLDGYRSYSLKVRYRLLPAVW